MKFIKLYAYLESNFGDDLMINILLNRYKDYKFYYCDKWENSDVFLKYKNFINDSYIFRKFKLLNNIVNIFMPTKMKNILINLIFRYINKNTVCSVYIGGSLFMQSNDISSECKLSEYAIKRLGDGKLFIIGASFGPYYQREYFEIYKDYFSKCLGVTFRDYYSFDLFKDLLQVRYSPDVVFSIDKSFLKSFISKDEQKDNVVISVIDFDTPKLKKYSEFYKSFIVNFCIETVSIGKYPILVSFCKNEGDDNAVYNIYSMLPEFVKKETKTVFYCDNNYEEILKLFNSACFILATRFHSMILALIFSKPFFAIAYAQKVSDYLNDLSFSFYCNLNDLESLNAKNILNQYFKGFKDNLYKIDKGQPFLQLDRFLYNEEL